MGYFNYMYESGALTFHTYAYRIGTYHYNWHNDIELLIVLRGAVEMCHDGACTRLESDDVIILPSQCGHATLALEPDTMAMVFHIPPKQLGRYGEQYLRRRFFAVSNETTRYNAFYSTLRSLVAQLWQPILVAREINSPTDDSAEGVIQQRVDNQLSVDVAYLRLLQLLTGAIDAAPHSDTAPPVFDTEATFMKMITYIDAHYTEAISLADMARLGGYSESYASQFFKRQLGISFKEYLLRMRLRAAAVNLVNSEENVVAIAHNCGFSDVKAFNVAFRKHFNSTPSQYRKAARQVQRQTMLEDWKEYLDLSDGTVADVLNSYVIADTVGAPTAEVLAVTKGAEAAAKLREAAETMADLRQRLEAMLAVVTQFEGKK